MAKPKRRRQFQFERLERRRLLAGTSPDTLEMVSSGDTYQGSSSVWQRTLVTPAVVANALGLPAIDLRTNLPGDQTVRIATDTSNWDGVQVSRDGQRFTRLLIDPSAVYEVNHYWVQESASVTLDAYDRSGASLGRFSIGVTNDQVDTNSNSQSVGWHRGYIGNPGDASALFVQLPLNTHSIELRSVLLTTIGFAGDTLDSGPSVIGWNEERSISSNRTLDLVQGDDSILVQPDKTYRLEATVSTQGSLTAVSHSIGYTAYDRSGLRIEPKHVERFGAASDTRLASTLNPGDTAFDLVDASGWSNLAGPETRALAWYGYSDASGQVYPDHTYTRNVASDAALGLWPIGGIVGNRVTLRVPWTGPTIAAGTAVRNAVDGPEPGLFSVLADNQPAPINAQATVRGFWKNGIPDPAAFPMGTASFRPAARLNETLLMTGYSQLSYRVSTTFTPAVSIDTAARTRSRLIDVLANDAVFMSAGSVLSAVSQPKYGSVQIVPANLPGVTGSRMQVRYTTAPYFVGTDRFSYTVIDTGGQALTEWVTVSNLGGNLEANPSLRQAVSQNNITPFTEVIDYGYSAFSVVSGAVLTSRSDNLNKLSLMLQPTTLAITYSLTKGVQHGTLSINADGTFTYQSEAGFVGSDTFEFTASNGQQTSTRVGVIRVYASVDEADRSKVTAIAYGLRNHESTYKRLFYSNVSSLYDASGAPLVSWRVHILPFLGYYELFEKFRVTEPWDSPNNLPLLSQMPDIYRSAGDATLSTSTRFHTIEAGSNPSTTEHFLNSNGSPRISNWGSVRHGLPNTLMVLRAGVDRAVPWTKPDDLPFDNANPLATLGNSPEPTIPVSFADATSALMPKNVTAATFTSLATIRESAGVTSVDGRTLMRAWSEQLSNPTAHAQNYTSKQLDSMRIVGIAVYNYESSFRLLPAWGSRDASGNRLLSWRVLLLPLLGHDELYNRFRLNEPWDSPHNLGLLNSMPDVYRSATDLSNTNTTRLRVLNGPGTLYDSALTGPLRASRILDGSTNTLFAVEAGTDKAVPWTMPETLTLGADFLASLGQLSDGMFRAIFADSSAVSIPTSTPNATLHALATYNKGETERLMPPWGVGEIQTSMRIIGLAIDNFESTYRRLPMNYWGDANPFTKKTTTPTLSWRVAILPFLEESALYNQFHFDEPWDSPHNLALLPLMPSVFRSHGLPFDSGLTRMQMFAGARTALKTDGTSLRRAELTDGSYDTLGVAEAGIDKAVPWTKPSDLDGEAIDLWQALGLVGDAFAVTMMDGSAQIITKRNYRYLNSLVLRNDGGSVPALEPITRIVMREGELAAIDLPTNIFTLDSSTILQTQTTPTTLSMPYATRLTMRATDNAVADGVRIVRLTYNTRVVEIVVLDDEGIGLTVDQTHISEAGGLATFTVTRPAIDLQTPLVVQIDSSNRARLVVPASVIIPAGQLSVSFTGVAIDNFTPGDADSVRVTAAASGLGASSVLIHIIDDESLQLSFSPAVITEFGGVTTGTLTRLGGLDVPLIVQLTHDQSNRASLPDQVIIPAGQTSVTFQAIAIDNSVYDGNIVVNVVAAAAGYVDTPGSFTIADFEAIGLTLSQEKISEADEVMTVTLTRTADSRGQPITVALQSSRPDKVSLPASVVIPGNAQRVSVQLRTIDNRILDGLTQVYVTALFGESAQAYAAGTVLVDVSDHEALSLTMTPPIISEKAGQSRGRLTRSNTDLDLPLTVSLVSSHPELAYVPAQVTIPSGAEYVEFIVDALDNDSLTPDTYVRLEAVHAAYLPEAMTFMVSDYEPLGLTFAVDTGGEGTQLTGVVSRSITNLDQAATVLLRTSDDTEVGVPTGVVIPAGERSVSFTIDLLRDRKIDGSQSVLVTAESTGYISATDNVTILDNEFITVALVENGPLTESDGVVMVRLTRSDLESEQTLVIQATSSAADVAYLNSSVLQIEAQQVSIEFPIFIVDDRVRESTQPVRFSFTVQDAAIADFILDIEVEDDDQSVWHNFDNPLDVNRSGSVTPLDALLVINYLNLYGGKPVSELPLSDPDQPTFVDTSNDQYLSAIDALLIINAINGQQTGEGELGWWDEWWLRRASAIGPTKS